MIGAFPRLSVLPFFRYSSTLNFCIFIMLWIWVELRSTFSRHNIKQAFCLWLIENVAKLNNLRASPVMQNMSEHVYYSEALKISYKILDFTYITQTIVGNTLVTEQPQYSSMPINLRNKLPWFPMNDNNCKRPFYHNVTTLSPFGLTWFGRHPSLTRELPYIRGTSFLLSE